MFCQGLIDDLLQDLIYSSLVNTSSIVHIVVPLASEVLFMESECHVNYYNESSVQGDSR